MATLRELRKQAKELGIPYEKDTTATALQELIVEKMCRMELEDGAAPASAAPAAPAPSTVADLTPAVRKPLTKAPEEVTTPSTPAAAPKIPAAPDPTPSPVEAAAAGIGRLKVGEPSFADDVEINEGDLNTEFKSQASKYASYANAEAYAKGKAMTAKLRLEVVDAEMTKKIRERLLTEGTKPTEKMIQSEVILSPEYQAAQQQLIDANRDADIARGAKEAFTQRRDMLIQLGSAKRQEVDQIGMGLREKAKEVLGTKAA